MKNLLKKIAILSIAVVVFGCSKDGADGVNGADGTNGNANVQSATVDVISSQWSYYSDLNQWYFGVSAPLITTSILNSGLVHVYMTTDSAITSNSTLFSLPFNLNGVNYSYNLSGNFITFSIGSSNNTNFSNAQLPTFLKFRYVVVPSSSGKMNINWKNYEEVKFKLNLKD